MEKSVAKRDVAPRCLHLCHFGKLQSEDPGTGSNVLLNSETTENSRTNIHTRGL